MRVWVSGASGRLGTAAVTDLHAAGHEVTGVDRAATGLARVELTDPDAVLRSLRGVDALLHLAARPSPLGVPASELVRNNVMATFNVLEAAAQLGVRRVVMASSGSIYGYAWSPGPIRPAYVPVDEDTPLAYVDPYALSKDLGEHAGRMYARLGLCVVALRPHWILDADELVGIRDALDPRQGARNLWGYVELGDAARACRLALEATLPAGSFHVLNVTAADTMMTRPTAELLDTWFPDVPRRRLLVGTESAFDCTAANRVIGWRPRFTWPT